MAGNAFLRFFLTPGSSALKGESQSDTFTGSKGWIEIGDWSWDIESETSIAKGSGASLGKPTSGVFSFSHPYDISAPPLMNNIVMGTSFAQAQLVMLKQTGKGTPEVYFGMQMSNVFVTKVASKGGEDGAVTQDIELVFTKVEVAYLMQNPDGSLNQAASGFLWDITKQLNAPVNTALIGAIGN